MSTVKLEYTLIRQLSSIVLASWILAILSRLIEEMIGQLPGITKSALCKAVMGPTCNLNQIKRACGRLIRLGKIERRGEGTEANPHKYFVTTVAGRKS